MKSGELISVIVPVYNVQQYLKRCIDSVLSQSYSNLELLLIDDGSTDESGRICDEFSKQDDRVRTFHQTNKGLSAARNRGLDEMNGKWLMFVDSDDYIAVDCIETLYTLALAGNQIASGSLVQTDQQNLDFEKYQGNKDFSVITGREAMASIYGYGPKLLSIVACGKLFSKAQFERWRFREGIIHEDEELIWKLLYECDRIAVTQRKVYAYYMAPNSIMRSGFSSKKLIYLDILSERAIFFKEVGDEFLWELTQKTRCYILFEFIRQSHKTDGVDRCVTQKLCREFNYWFWRVMRMKAVDRKSKCSLILMRFFPMAYLVLKR